MTLDREKAIRELEYDFPGTEIFQGEGMVGVEVERTDQESTAVLIVDLIKQHYYSDTTQRISVERGSLSILVAAKQTVLNEGEEQIVSPGKVTAFSGEARIKVVSTPPWRESDKTRVFRRVFPGQE